ncbi:MAG: SpoIIE family protein phosphatase [Bacteroidetes bacterium]|nr:SpoIIE family protein phosphatase [Bacteroidota bacterium]
MVLLLSYCFVDSPFLTENVPEIATFGTLPIKILILILSFRQMWIVFLSKREKLYNLFYTLFLSGLYVAILGIISIETSMQKILQYFSTPLYHFLLYNLSFSGVYFGTAFVSTLFHLPTAEAFERKQSELRSLQNVSQFIRNVFDFDQLVTNILRIARNVCGATSAWLEMYTDTNSEKQFHAAIVAGENVDQHIAHALSQHAMFLNSANIKPFVIEDIWNDRRTRHVRRIGIDRLALSVFPLVSHGTLIGALYVTKTIEDGFFQDDIEVLSILADHASITIENSQLIQKSIERERLKQEFLVAQKMQQRLFPQNIPTCHGFDIAAVSIPSYEVGGDYYDVIQLPDNCLGIIVGDVAGKGISAAFYMAEVKGIFLTLSSSSMSPKEFLVKANEALKESLDKRTFISLEYAVLNGKKRLVTIARAGHCPALHISNNQVTIIRPSGLGIGLADTDLFECSTEEYTLMMREGDVLLFFTDGISEARNKRGEEFGIERLSEIVKKNIHVNAETLKRMITDAVLQYIGNSEYKDDITLVIVKCSSTTSCMDDR